MASSEWKLYSLFATPYSPGSAIMRALRLDIDGIERLAGRHEQAVSFLAAEADIGAGLGQTDLTDARAIGREHLDAIVAVADPTGADPDVAIDVDPHPSGNPDLPSSVMSISVRGLESLSLLRSYCQTMFLALG